MEINMIELVNTVIVPTLEIAFPIGLVFALTEKVITMIYNSIGGGKNVKL